jgi:hypothetical protein
VFSEFSDKGKEALGKAYLLTGLVPATVAVVGFLCVLLGPAVVVEKITELIGSESKVEITWTTISIVVLSFVLTVVREAVVSLFENLPGKFLSCLRDWLVARALRTRGRLKSRLAILEAEYSIVRWLIGEGKSSLFVSKAAFVMKWEEVTRLNNRAFACAYGHSDRLRISSGTPQMNAKEVRQICEGLLSLLAFLKANPESSLANSESEKWKDWASRNGAPAKSTLKWILDYKTAEIAEAWSKSIRFPDARWIKPTELGNRFSALQDYAERRYKMETSLLWERVWWVLPKEHRKEIGATRTIIESLLVLDLVFIGLAGLAASILVIKLSGINFFKPMDGGSTSQLVITLIVLIFCAFISYRLGPVPAESFVRKVESLIDLYRLPLLRAVGTQPKSVQEELDIFKELGVFWLQGVPRKNLRPIKPSAAGSDEKKDE